MAQDVGIGGAAAVVDDDAAALADRQAGGARQLVAGADAGREHHQVGARARRRRRSSSPLTRAVSSPTTSLVTMPVCTATPRLSMRPRRMAPPTSSTCSGISRGASSTTWVSRPRLRSALAASSPSKPAADHRARR